MANEKPRRASASPAVSRRRAVAGSLGLALTLPLGLAARPVPLGAQALQATPRQTAGPFYPTRMPADRDNDLVRVAGQDREAAGQVTHLSGRVTDLTGRPLARYRVEIWQCDTRQYYHHSRDRGSGDDGFQGFGQTLTDGDGMYAFRTIKPVPYPGRTPHIHMAVLRDGMKPFTTQLYVRGEPRNEKDGLFRWLDERGLSDAVLADFVPAPELETGALSARFDIVLDLARET